MVFRYFVLLMVFGVLVGCSATTAPPSESQSCEQQFDRALERGVNYTTALGNYTQCLLERGDTVDLDVKGR